MKLRRITLVAWAVAGVLILLVAATILTLVWFYRDRAWLRDFPPGDYWIVAVRVDGDPPILDVYEPGREMALRAVEAMNTEYPGQLDWAHGRAGERGQTWPAYGSSRMVLSRSKAGPLPGPEVLLQHCVRSLERVRGSRVYGTWRVVVRDDEGRLAGPVKLKFPEPRE